MSKQPINTLKQWFISKAKPLSVQFWHWMDSYWHKDEQIPSASIDGLQELLDAKLDKNAAVDPDQVGPYDPLKNYVYDAQLAEYVSFSNPASSNPQFMVEGFYRLLEDAPAGENPETHPQHWAYQGYQIGDITIADVIGLREELDTLKYANGILLPNPETQSLSGIATNVAAALDELRSATIAIRDAVRRLAGAACTIEADPVPQAVGTTPTLFDFTTTYPSTNTDVLTVDDTANKLGVFLNGRWQFSTYIAVQNASAQDRILYLRIINDDTDEVLSSRPLDVPKNSIVIPPLATAPFDVVAAPHNIRLEFLADGTGVSVLSLETTLTTSGGNTSAAAGLPSTWEANKAAIRARGGYQEGEDIGDYETGSVYEFDSTSMAVDDNDTYLLPGDVDVSESGRLIKRKTFVVESSLNEYGRLSDVNPIRFFCSDNDSDLTTDNRGFQYAQRNQTITSIFLAVETAPTGSGLILNVYKNGVSILSGNVTIIAGTNTITVTTPTITDTSILAGDKMEVKVISPGLTVAGAGLSAYFNTTLI